MLAVFQDTPRAWEIRATIHDERPRPSAPSAPPHARASHADRPLGSVVTPHVSALWAPVASHAHVQKRGTPPVRLVRQAPDHRVTRHPLAPAASAPPVLTNNTARQHCMVWLNVLARHLQPQAIQASARTHIRVIKASIGHVEVFRMDGVGISIIERPRPLPGHDTPNPANHTYTLKREEPG